MYYFLAKIFTNIKNYMIIGCMVIVPVFLSFYIVYIIISFFDKVFIDYFPFPWKHYNILGMGLLIIALLFTIIGFVMVHILGKAISSIPSKLINYLPVVRAVYNTIEKIFVITMDKENRYFSQVVLVPYPSKNIWSIGFVTLKTQHEIARVLNQEVYTVFISTSPSPLSGMIAYIPKKDVIPIDISIEEAFALILSLGTLEINSNFPLKNVKKCLDSSYKKVKK